MPSLADLNAKTKMTPIHSDALLLGEIYPFHTRDDSTYAAIAYFRCLERQYKVFSRVFIDFSFASSVKIVDFAWHGKRVCCRCFFQVILKATGNFGNVSLL